MLPRLFYFFRQAVLGMRRNLLMSLIGIGIMMVAFFLFGAFMLVVLNLNHMADTAESGLEFAVYLEDGLNEQETWQVKKRLIDWDLTYDVRYVSPDMALERLRETWPGQEELLEIGDTNPLPRSFEARLSEPHRAAQMAEEVSSWSGVESVGYGQGLISYLLAVTRTIRWIGLILLLLVGGGLIFIIANTIRLTVHARRREIEIMKFVGATDWFIRCPFLFEGMLIGLSGSLLSGILLFFGYRSALALLSESLPFVPVIRSSRVLLIYLFKLLGGGVILGGLGSISAVKKYVDV